MGSPNENGHLALSDAKAVRRGLGATWPVHTNSRITTDWIMQKISRPDIGRLCSLLPMAFCYRYLRYRLVPVTPIATPADDYFIKANSKGQGLSSQSGVRDPHRYIHSRSSWSLITPRTSLAPRFRSRASVQLHARPRVSLRPANLLLNTAEWGHEKQISSRGHAAPE